jgi:tRNA nucleotidyltransferase (CCA-adding enzyme)
MEFHTHCHRAFELRPETLLNLLESLGAFRQSTKLENYLLSCEADSRGRPGFEEKDYPQADWIKRAYLAASEIKAKEFVEQGLTGKLIAEALYKKRVDVIKKFIDGAR